MGLCDLPTAGAACDAVGAAAGNAAAGAAASVFDAAANKVAEGFADATRMIVTFWTGVSVPGLSATSGPVAELRENTAWLTAFIAVLSVLVCAGRLALTRSSRPAGEAFKGLMILVLVSGAGVAAVNALVVFSDSYSTWILERSTDGQLGERMAKLALISTTVPGLGPGLLLIVALLGILASIAQIGLMLVRVGVVTIFAGLLPLAAAGTGTQTGMEWFKRIVAWLLAFVLYKPVAATVYASAFLLVGDGQDATSVLSGFFMLILSIIALPAMLRLTTPMVGAAVAAGAGAGGGMAAAGMLLASGARMSSGAGAGRLSPSAGGGQQPGLTPSGSGSPGGHGPSAGPGPAGRSPGGGDGAPAGGAGKAGAGAGAGAAAGAQAAFQVGRSAAAAARAAAGGSTAGMDAPSGPAGAGARG